MGDCRMGGRAVYVMPAREPRTVSDGVESLCPECGHVTFGTNCYAEAMAYRGTDFGELDEAPRFCARCGVAFDPASWEESR